MAGFILGAIIFFLAGCYRKKVAEKEIGSAEDEARRLVNDAIKAGENKKREMLVEAKEEIHKSRTESEKENKERRAELQKKERRLQQKEESLDKKLDSFERKEEDLQKSSSRLPPPRRRSISLKRASWKCWKSSPA